ncbi:Putative uncharacterized protein, chloroplastic [Termitomyces sp. J132]|nr:Putative uncharacterized protein, chloroplastic [Termitomyces sp. J132]
METITCVRCTTVVCASCRQVAHPGDTCTEIISILAVKKLAQEQRWQTCPKCHAIIEKTIGCNHMTCLCSSNFCYGCGRLMNQCKC